MKKLNIAALIMGAAGMFGAGALRRATPKLKARPWHDPKRVDAAAARRKARQLRNLRQAAAGGYGTYWAAT